MIPSRRPFILGHRGASAHARANTIEAYRLAVAEGADGIECDVRFTADGVVMMHHDPVVPGLGALNGATFAQIRRLHPHIPTLDETLAALPEPGFLLNIEIKNDSDEPDFDPSHRMAGVIASWVAAHDLHDRVLVTSFNRATVDEVRRADTTMATGLLLRHGWRLRPHLASLAADGHRWVLPHHTTLLIDPHRRIAAAHDAGMRIGTWTLDSLRRVARLARAGIDAVITNDPRRYAARVR